MNDPHSQDNEQSGGWGVAGSLVTGLVIVVFILFLPLIAALAEHSVAGTNHVEQFCRRVGIHDFLSAIYQPVLKLLGIP